MEVGDASLLIISGGDGDLLEVGDGDADADAGGAVFFIALEWSRSEGDEPQRGRRLVSPRGP